MGHRSFLMAVALWVTQTVLVQRPKKCKKTPFFLSTSHFMSPLTLFQMILVPVFETKPFHINIFQYAVSQTKHSFIYLQFYTFWMEYVNKLIQL